MTFSLVDPRAKFIAPDHTATVQREVDPYLVVMWDAQRHKWAVYDTKAPGGPEAGYVMLVQEPDGSFRSFDNRTIETLRKLRFGHDRAKKELDDIAAERERTFASRTEARSADIADGFKWFGSQWTPSVAWRDRSLRKAK